MIVAILLFSCNSGNKEKKAEDPEEYKLWAVNLLLTSNEAFLEKAHNVDDDNASLSHYDYADVYSEQ